MHELEFCNSFQPAQTKILGVPMENYAIGHEIALIREGNPLVTYGDQSLSELSPEAKRIALVMAVEVCGKNKFWKKLLFTVAIGRASDKFLNKQIGLFKRYRSAGSLDLPQAKMPKQQGVPFRYFGSPGLASLINYISERHSVLIQTHFGGSPLNFPLGLAQILYATHLESVGAIWVKNRHEMEKDAPKKPGTPDAGENEKVLIGEEAEKAIAEAKAAAMKGKL